MIATVLLTAAIAAGLVPLIQRDLRLAHARAVHRRRRAAMTPLQRALEDLPTALSRAFRPLIAGMAGFGHAYRAEAAEEARRAAERARRGGHR